MKTLFASICLLLFLSLDVLGQGLPPYVRNPMSTNSAVAVPANLEVPQWNGTAWDFVAMSGGSGAPSTNLIQSLTSTNGYFIYTGTANGNSNAFFVMTNAAGNAANLTNVPFRSTTNLIQSLTSTNGYWQYTVTANGNTNANFVLTNTPGSTISGTLTAQVINYTDLLENIDTNTLPLALLAYPYDTGGMRVGDGATLGGLPMSYRPWAFGVWSASGSRAGELAVYLQNLDTNSITSTLFLNAGAGTNWVPLFRVAGTNYAATYIAYGGGAINNDNVIDAIAQYPVVSFNTGRFGSNAVPELILGVPSPPLDSVFDIVNGDGGDAVVGGFGGAGGQFGDPVFLIATGSGGLGLAADAYGGTGGGFADGSSPFLLRGGRGGNSSFAGFLGGLGGNVSGLRSVGGNGANATASADGVIGGDTGRIDISGGGAFAGGSILVHSPSNRIGGTLETFRDSYSPATLFTVISTAGPTNTTAETTILGTVASYGTGTKTVGSNVVDHIGRTFRFRASGFINTTLTPTIDLKFKFGATAALDTTAVALGAITGTQSWVYEGEFTFRTVGSSGTCIGQSRFSYYTANGLMSSISAPVTATTTINTTIDQTIDITAQFSSAALNSLKCTTAFVELIN